VGKRGAKPYEQHTSGKIMPLRVIAQRTGWSKYCVTTTYHTAIKKIIETPGAFDALLLAIRVKHIEERQVMHNVSAECSTPHA
jgi:hypothetical protein